MPGLAAGPGGCQPTNRGGIMSISTVKLGGVVAE